MAETSRLVVMTYISCCLVLFARGNAGGDACLDVNTRQQLDVPTVAFVAGILEQLMIGGGPGQHRLVKLPGPGGHRWGLDPCLLRGWGGRQSTGYARRRA